MRCDNLYQVLSSKVESWNNYDSLGGLVTRLYCTVGSYFHVVVKPYPAQSLESQYQVHWSLGVYQHQIVFPPMSRY